LLEPSIVSTPRARLTHHLVAHNSLGREKTQQAKLREAAKQARDRAKRGEPAPRHGVMDLRLICEGNPHVDVREKK